MIGAPSIKRNHEFNRTLNFRYHNIRFGRKSRGTDNKTGGKSGGEKRNATTSSCATWNKGAPGNGNGNGNVSANGNALCWNESAGYTLPIGIPTETEIMVITAITI